MHSPSTRRARAWQSVRKIFTSSHHHFPTIQRLRQTNVVERLVRCLALARLPRLQFELVWALSMATWDMADVVFASGVVQHYVDLLTSPSGGIREQTCWALGNLAAVGSQQADEILARGGLEHALVVLEAVSEVQDADYARVYQESALFEHGMPAVTTTRANLLKQASWAVSALVRHGSLTVQQASRLADSLPALAALLYTADDPSVWANVTWTLADFAAFNARRVVELGVFSKLLVEALHPHLTVRGGSLRCICLILASDGVAARMLVAKGLLTVLASTLALRQAELYSDAAWALSAMCSMGAWFTARMLDNKMLVLVLAKRAAQSTLDSETKRDALRVIVRLVEDTRSAEDARHMGGALGVFVALASALDSTYDPVVVELALDATRAFLAVGRRSGDRGLIARELEEAGCLTRLHALERTLPVKLPLWAKVQAVIDCFADEWDEQGWFAASVALPRELGAVEVRQPLQPFEPDFNV